MGSWKYLNLLFTNFLENCCGSKKGSSFFFGFLFNHKHHLTIIINLTKLYPFSKLFITDKSAYMFGSIVSASITRLLVSPVSYPLIVVTEYPT
jgi:hypothetical protein